MYRHFKNLVFFAAGCSLLSSATVDAQDRPEKAGPRKHVFATLDSVAWSPVPNVEGIAVAVLEGDPNAKGSAYTIWIKAKEGTPGGVVPFHWHPTDERIVVLRGVMGVSMGKLFDLTQGAEYPSGSFVLLLAGMRHSTWVRGETVMQVSGVGPFVTCIVSPVERRGELPPQCVARAKR